MIRFLQKDNRVVKALFVVIIAAASVSMVVYLIPGLTGQGASSANTYAVIYPHWYSKFFSSGDTITQDKVAQMARQQLQQRNPQYASNPMIVNLFEQQVGQQMVSQEILLAEAAKLGVTASDSDVRQFLHTGQAGQVLYPNGTFIGTNAYTQLIASRFDMSVADFEESVRHDITIHRLESLITAGVSVSDKEVARPYRKQNVKIKFDYAVISVGRPAQDDQSFGCGAGGVFQEECGAVCDGGAGERTITYFAFTPNDLPGGVPQPTQQEIQQYFNAHQAEYSVPGAGAVAAHPDQGGRRARMRRPMRRRKPRRRDILKQLQGGQLCGPGEEVLRRPGQQGLRAASWDLRSAGAWCRSLTMPSSRRRLATRRSSRRNTAITLCR